MQNYLCQLIISINSSFYNTLTIKYLLLSFYSFLYAVNYKCDCLCMIGERNKRLLGVECITAALALICEMFLYFYSPYIHSCQGGSNPGTIFTTI